MSEDIPRAARTDSLADDREDHIPDNELVTVEQNDENPDGLNLDIDWARLGLDRDEARRARVEGHVRDNLQQFVGQAITPELRGQVAEVVRGFLRELGRREFGFEVEVNPARKTRVEDGRLVRVKPGTDLKVDIKMELPMPIRIITPEEFANGDEY